MLLDFLLMPRTLDMVETDVTFAFITQVLFLEGVKDRKSSNLNNSLSQLGFTGITIYYMPTTALLMGLYIALLMGLHIITIAMSHGALICVLHILRASYRSVAVAGPISHMPKLESIGMGIASAQKGIVAACQGIISAHVDGFHRTTMVTNPATTMFLGGYKKKAIVFSDIIMSLLMPTHVGNSPPPVSSFMIMCSYLRPPSI